MSENNYETVVTLPSRGILYENIPDKFTLRMITTSEEKYLYGSSNNVFDKVLKNCIVEPKNLNLDDLLPADELFLVFQLRIHTYGPEYRVSGTCPKCGEKHTYTINLDDAECYYLPEDFVEPLEFELPVTKSKLSIRLLRKKDFESVRNKAKKLAKSTSSSPKELEYILKMAKYIQKIDDKEVDSIQAQSFVEKLPGKDSAYFWWKLDELVKCGIDPIANVQCNNCGEEFDLSYGISSEFFRPKFE